MKLSILILNFRQETLCARLLRSLEKFAPNFPFEILLVDNCSGEENFLALQSAVRGLPNTFQRKVQLLQTKKNLGFSAGNNFGLRRARGEFVAICNPDTEVFLPGTFERLVSFLQENEKVGVCGPKIIFSNGQTQDSFRAFPTIFDLLVKRTFLSRMFKKRLAKFLLWEIDLSRPQKVDWLVGAFFVARRNALESCGNFDERFFLFFEDTELCRLMWAKGWKVFFLPHVCVLHEKHRLSGRTLLGEILKKTFWIHVASGVKYFLKA